MSTKVVAKTDPAESAWASWRGSRAGRLRDRVLRPRPGLAPAATRTGG
jgi:hypothetical protein